MFLSKSRLQKLLLLPDDPISNAVKCIDLGEKGIALVVETIERGKIVATITDGDIRRAILSGVSLDQPVSKLIEIHSKFGDSIPVTAKLGTPLKELLSIMQTKVIRQIPILDNGGVVIDLVTIDDLQPREKLPIQAVIMAGGEGIRLRPLTDELPKPMLPISNQPLLELIINQLRESGIWNLNIAIRYKKEKIINHFSDGKSFGVNIKYFSENEPLGTAGALGLMGPFKEPILVINGDILTRLDFREMFRYHQKHNASLTIGVRGVDFMVPFGVVECEGAHVINLREKPTYNYLVNAGLYILDPLVYNYIPGGKKLDMTELIQILLLHNKPVIQYPIVEYWMDIGKFADYQKAQDDVEERNEGNV